MDELLERALSMAERSPWEGWQRARAAYESILCTHHPLLQAQATLVLGRTLVLCERFQEAVQTIAQAQQMFSRLEHAAGIALCRWQTGVVLRFQAHESEAVVLLEAAAAELTELGLEEDAARARRDLAVAYNLLDRFDEAQQLIQSVRPFFVHRSAPVEVARCDLVTGAGLCRLSRTQEALPVLQSALHVFRSNDQSIDVGKTLQMMALLYLQTHAYDAALSCLDEAAHIFAAADLHLRLAYCNEAKGRVLWRRGQLDAARSYLNRALDWFESQGMRRDVGDCLLNLGNLEFTEGALAGAESMYQQALSCYEQLNAGIDVARCRQNLALIYRQKGQWSAALDHLHRATDALKQHGVPIWEADCHIKMADLYARLQQRERALHHLELAQEIYRREGVILSAAWCDVLYLQIAGQGTDSDDALTTLRGACQAIETTGSKWHTGLCYRLMGDLLLSNARIVEALKQYETAQGYFSTVDAVIDHAITLAGIGRACALLGKHERAEQALRTSLQTTLEALPEWSWPACTALGEMAQTRGDTQASLHWYRLAVEALGTIRQTLPEEELAAGLVAASHFVYETGIALALAVEDDAQAIAMVEESKARVLERLVRSDPILPAADPYLGELYEREAQLRGVIASLRHQAAFSFERLSSPPVEPVQNPQELLATLRTKRSEHRQILRQIRAAASGLPEPVEPFTWAQFCQLANDALHTEWSVLAYYWLDQDLVILHGTARGLQAHVRPLGRVDRAALEMCTALAPERRRLAFQGQLHRDMAPSRVGQQYRRRLYDLLIPADVTLDPERLLLIIPHGPLHYLPFHALENDAGFLVQQATPFYAPSLRILQGLWERSKRRPGPIDLALLVGVSIFLQDKPPLPWVPEEVNRLVAVYGERASTLCDTGATIDSFRRWIEQNPLDRVSVMHFATHADLDVASGALSGIAFRDANLTAEEVGRLRLGPATVVLSACQSGLGEVQAGDEVFGLPYAFFAAGVQSVVASQWHVNDECTADLMSTLHRLLDQGGSPARALAHTQRLAIRQGISAYVWGAFAAMGVP